MPWEDADLVPVSALQHYVYCPRQCALIHVECVWEENLYTMRGNRAHKQVDLPHEMMHEGMQVEYSLPIWSERLGLIGKADVVEFPNGVPYPVEHKVGRRQSRHADEVQLCAQALCLEEMLGVAVPKGAIFYRASRRRREIPFTDRLRREILQITNEVRVLLAQTRLPPPVSDGRCRNCSLVEICMPQLPLVLEAEEEMP